MFDGYSFDTDEAHLDRIYQENYRAYGRIFTRCGLEYLAVEADPGAIGGSFTLSFVLGNIKYTTPSLAWDASQSDVQTAFDDATNGTTTFPSNGVTASVGNVNTTGIIVTCNGTIRVAISVTNSAPRPRKRTRANA